MEAVSIVVVTVVQVVLQFFTMCKVNNSCHNLLMANFSTSTSLRINGKYCHLVFRSTQVVEFISVDGKLE